MAISEDEELELLTLERERAMQQTGNSNQPQNESFDYSPAALSAASQAIHQMSPDALLQKQLGQDIATNPGEVVKRPIVQAGLPIIGGVVGGPAGAVAGEAARQFLGSAVAPETVPETALGRAASMATAGIAQEPKVLNAIPGVPQVAGLMKNLASKAGTNLAKFGEALTGAKAQDLKQAARQGLSTYAAPSLEDAQKIFGEALKKEGVDMTPTLKQTFDPQLTSARKIALDVGSKIEQGIPVGAEEILKARQAADRIYSATPIIDRTGRKAILDWRNKFDDLLSNQAKGLKDASDTYRKALVKSNILNPFRITKQGQMSAVAPMIATLAASAGLGSGHKGESGLGALGYLGASSPAVAGGIATAGGSALNALNTIGGNPVARQVLLQVLQRIKANQAQKAAQ